MPDFTFHHAAVSVPCLDAAIEWYGRVLGYVVEKRFHVAPASAQAAMLRNGAMRVEVFEPVGAAPLPDGRSHPLSDLKTHGTKHPAYRVPDLDGFIAEMEAKDVEIAFVVRESFGSGCFVRDCAGNLIEFVEEAD